MLFNSVDFLVFLPVVFALYWFVFNKNLSAQNILLLVASYFFYACWDYRFLFLLIFSTFLDYYTGLKIAEAQKPNRKRFWLWLSVTINLGFLAIFKYYDFFATSFAESLSYLGFKADAWTLKLILPVGISFYTFHGLSYVLDIYYERIKPERNFVSYSVFVCFFPLLVAGPIERATHLLPQILHERKFRYTQAVSGLRLMLWGMFKKVVIADSLSGPVNDIFANYDQFAGFTLILGAVFFAIQIYCDFSGYSDIAIGTARLFGIELLKNFNFPYFSKSIAEFWRRWHISLSSWFRDYLYIPLGGSRTGTAKAIRNVFVIFLVSGFWHGANWTFIIWGFLHALFFIPSFIFKKSNTRPGPALAPRIQNLLAVPQVLWTFIIVCFAWIFFRAESVTHALGYIRHMSFDFSADYMVSAKYLVIFLCIEGVVYYFNKLDLNNWYFRFLRYAVYSYVLISIITHSTRAGSDFIYFQF